MALSLRSLLLPFLLLAFGVFPIRGDITPFQFEQITRLCLPSQSNQGWLELEWEIDLWAARKRAAREGKPVFLWEMDGHPLGCT